MKIIANLPGFAKLLHSLKYMNTNKKIIENAKTSGDAELEREYILKSTSVWGEMVFKMFGSELILYGEENIPEKGPVVFIGNHQGYADIIAYFKAFTKFQFGFVAKDELGNLPFFGKWIARIRSVFIERDDARASLKAIKEGIEYINQGYSLVIFPEGTRSKGPDPGAFMKGSTKLATKPGVPIIPVSLNGTYRMFEEEGRIRGAKISMMVHKPIETKGISREEEKGLSDKIEKIVKDGVRELQARENGGLPEITSSADTADAPAASDGTEN